MTTPVLVEHGGTPRAVLRVVNDFGFVSFDLVGAPRRVVPPSDPIPLVEQAVDSRRVKTLPTPAALHQPGAQGEPWLTISARSVGRLAAAFLIGEDPQGRLEASKAATLMHQVSLVQHILTSPNLRKVLIGDEVGLGKTIEAGLLIKRLLAQQPHLRILYFAPARLVSNVISEFRNKLDLDARRWVAGANSDARLDADQIVVASIHKAVFSQNFDLVVRSGPWDVLIADECHHLSDWEIDGGKPNQGYKLIRDLARKLPEDGRLVLMSGTPHQGSEARFTNLLRLLSDDEKDLHSAAGRVIFRTKDRVRDWRGRPLFPAREIHKPIVVSLGEPWREWYFGIGELYDRPSSSGSEARAAGWAKGQALQWAASSVQAGLGFLARLGIRRLGWDVRNDALSRALLALRPYRGGAADEPLPSLFERVVKQIGANEILGEALEDAEDIEEETWRPDPEELRRLIGAGIALLGTAVAEAKWNALARLIDDAGTEKIVFFAQPVETVTVVARYLERRYRQAPAMIIGDQSEEDRQAAVSAFQSEHGPRFLVSSRAGGEGLNMQRARRLIHLDVPWNPMDLEQRIGRIHRFGSKKTIIVDTVVAEGSREVDMYRVAREKLALVARQLDPEQFELLFSRVMSLVPPRELEELIGSLPRGPFPPAAENKIASLVVEGFNAWSSFDQRYRRQAEEIRAQNPGEATWTDLAQFLLKVTNATPGPDVSVTAFEYREDEIVAVDEALPTISHRGGVYACGDTGGLPIDPVDGHMVTALGTNVPSVQQALRDALLDARHAGPALLRLPGTLEFLRDDKEPVAVLAFMRQTLRQDLGRSTEQTVSLHMYRVRASQAHEALTSEQRAAVARSALVATRLRDPVETVVVESLIQAERGLVDELRRPSPEEVEIGVRHAVWPITAIIFV